MDIIDSKLKEDLLEEDFLEVDQKIPGQNFTCLSFVTPKCLPEKQVFFLHSFLKTIAKNYDLDEDSIQEKYKDFLYINEEKLDSEFYEKNDFQTTISGLKVRGTYDSLKEAQVRAKVLQRKDPNFNVFVAPVGYWLPWDPHPHKIDEQEYAEKELNTLVKKYKENQENKEKHFNDNIKYAKEQAAKAKEDKKKVNLPTELSSLEDVDPWLKNKENNSE
jgi:hypothetical protein